MAPKTNLNNYPKPAQLIGPQIPFAWWLISLPDVKKKCTSSQQRQQTTTVKHVDREMQSKAINFIVNQQIIIPGTYQTKKTQSIKK